jgi:D-sedoheptulose 7-phosphate isomerase
MDFVEQEISNTIAVYRRFQQSPALIAQLQSAGEACGKALQQGRKILLAGNGGSAADAQHIAAEFIVRLCGDRKALPAIALTTDTSVLTATGNDYGFEQVFSRQVDALGNEGDVFIGISTSGSSPNIVRAMQIAREKRLVTIALTGERPTPLADLADFLLQVPSTRTQNIQEVHIMMGHTICSIAERAFMPQQQAAPGAKELSHTAR